MKTLIETKVKLYIFNLISKITKKKSKINLKEFTIP